jgi:hypothetical protein
MTIITMKDFEIAYFVITAVKKYYFFLVLSATI